VVPVREAKSISVEDTYDSDLVDRRLLEGLVDRHATRVTERLRKARLSGRTVTVKVRLHDFSTHTRSTTLPAPTDSPRVVTRLARSLLSEVDTSGGVRLLGVGVSGLADWIQDDLFDLDGDDGPQPDESVEEPPPAVDLARSSGDRRWWPGQDVEHAEHGPGWVWGSGVGRVTVRFETAETGPGPVRTFRVDDSGLAPRRRPSGEPDESP
jgi:DNA polymerase IV